MALYSSQTCEPYKSGIQSSQIASPAGRTSDGSAPTACPDPEFKGRINPKLDRDGSYISGSSQVRPPLANFKKACTIEDQRSEDRNDQKMKGQTLDIFATSEDMLELCKELEDSIDISYAFVKSYKYPEVVVSTSASEIDLFWTSPSGFLGRSILLVPIEYEPKARVTELTRGDKSYSLYPVDVERCVILQEGGIFVKDDCLIAGRIARTHSDDWSKTTFDAISRMTKRRFNKMRSYYLGVNANQRFQNGYRLTFQSSAPRHSDLSSIEQ